MAELAPTLVAGAAGADTDPDFMIESDPFGLFERWFGEATATEVNDPNAMSLATVDADGMPNVRIVLLKGLDTGGLPGLDSAPGLQTDPQAGQTGNHNRGFVFYTNTQSTKGRELAGTPKAALLFHWKGQRRQVRIRGHIAPVTSAEADAYYASRARGSRIGAWASQQSSPLAARQDLEAEVARLEALYPGDIDIPRPPHWSGYRLTPVEIEFWCERQFRLHDRAVFRRSAEGTEWTRQRLFP